MRRKSGELLAAAFALAACNPSGTNKPFGSSAPQLSELQELATRDCQCRLAGFNSSRHAKEYSRLSEKLGREGFATPSFPVSYESECFPALGENACVSTGGYLPPDAGDFICTEAQGIELEALWKRAYEGGASEKEADKAVRQRFGTMRDAAKKALRSEDCT